MDGGRGEEVVTARGMKNCKGTEGTKSARKHESSEAERVRDEKIEVLRKRQRAAPAAPV